MKAARRQELRTNELSQQIDKLGETFKRNSTTLTAIIVGAIVIVMAMYWYSNSKANAVDQGVAQLSFDSTKEDITAFIDRCKSVANQNVSPEVTRMAWLRIGSASLSELTKPKTSIDETKPAAKMPRDQLSAAAKDAFDRVVSTAGNDTNSKAAAKFALGLLAENAGDFGSARKQYEEIKNDKSLTETPFIKQAEFRLSQLDNWAKPVVFAEPPVLPPAPDATTFSPPTGTTPPSVPAGMTPTAVAPKTETAAPTPAATPPAQQPGDATATPSTAAPAPTSAPAP